MDHEEVLELSLEKTALTPQGTPTSDANKPTSKLRVGVTLFLVIALIFDVLSLTSKFYWAMYLPGAREAMHNTNSCFSLLYMKPI